MEWDTRTTEQASRLVTISVMIDHINRFATTSMPTVYIVINIHIQVAGWNTIYKVNRQINRCTKSMIPVDGSSKNTIDGSPIIAIATDSFLLFPPTRSSTIDWPVDPTSLIWENNLNMFRLVGQHTQASPSLLSCRSRHVLNPWQQSLEPHTD